MLITAGRTLAMRFNPKGQYLRSFVAPESLFIDIMMNVPIIFYAAREAGDKALYDLAVAHCRTTERTLVRPDGGTAHEGIFDPETGRFLRQTTHQGLRGDSDWSRGLAWSLYGYSTVSTYTNDPADLDVSGGTRSTSSTAAPRASSPPGTSTSRTAPTGSTTARPRRSPRRASGTSPSSSATPAAPGTTATPP